MAELRPESFALEVERAEAQRRDITERYPLPGWAQMRLDQYAQGTGDESFCSWLEHKSPNLGLMPARKASIHLIYKQKGDEGWKFPDGYESVEEAWAAVRAGYCQAFELAQSGDYAAIDALPAFGSGRLTLAKALHVYFPDRFIAICAKSHLDYFLRRVLRERWAEGVHGRMGPIELSAALLEALRAIPELASSTSVELMYFLYGWSDHRDRPVGVLKVTPGEDGRAWRDCVREGCVFVGWDELGDLGQYRSKASLRRAIEERFGERYDQRSGTAAESARELWLLRNAQAGAIVVADDGTGRTLGVGAVREPGYRWHPERASYRHTVDIDWDADLGGPAAPQSGWATTTVEELGPEAWDAVLSPITEGESPSLPAGDQPRPSRWWLFQCDPARYDLDAAMSGSRGTYWRATRYAGEIQEGDRVFMWVSGAGGGVRGIARVARGAHTPPATPDPYVRDSVALEKSRLAVDLVWERALPQGPSREVVKATLGHLDILRMPMATNYRISDDDAQALLALINDCSGRTAAPPPTFDGVMRALDDAELLFPVEVVANLILALQVRRFVILTGISGTGKTRIAMTLAEQYPLWRERRVAAEAIPDGTVAVEVKPYMLRHRRFVLPAELANQIPALAGAQGSRTLEVEWPGGVDTLSVWCKHSVTLYLKGALRRWFEESLSEGSTVLLELVDPDAPSPSRVRLRLPRTLRPTTELVSNTVVIPVRPDWTDNRGLLGYMNPLTERYQATPLLELLLRARDEADAARNASRPAHPFFVILDEMNLARVEHYFSDLLSTLESERPLPLHQGPEVTDEDDELSVPREVAVPENLFFIGTVNVDESTYMFSPKVLDRAFTIEFHDVDLTGERMSAPSPLRLDRWDGRLGYLGRATRRSWRELAGQGGDAAGLHREVTELHTLLQEDSRHFGHRVANEIAAFVLLAAAQASDPAAARAAMDVAILQKVLPKLHGTRQELGPLLDRLRAFALGTDIGNLPSWRWSLQSGWAGDTDSAAPRFPRTAAKLWRMFQRLRHHGFTSFVE